MERYFTLFKDKEISKVTNLYEKLLGRLFQGPYGFAKPGFLVNINLVHVVKEHNLKIDNDKKMNDLIMSYAIKEFPSSSNNLENIRKRTTCETCDIKDEVMQDELKNYKNDILKIFKENNVENVEDKLNKLICDYELHLLIKSNYEIINIYQIILNEKVKEEFKNIMVKKDNLMHNFFNFLKTLLKYKYGIGIDMVPEVYTQVDNMLFEFVYSK